MAFDDSASALRVLAPTSAPIQPFLRWAVATDPAAWDAEVALLGVPHSEPYPGDPNPNDQTRAPDAVRRSSGQISDGSTHWDFDLNVDLASVLPRCMDCGDVPWAGGSYDTYAARVTGLARRLLEVHGVRRGYSSPLYWASQQPWISGMTQIGLRGTGSARRAEVEAARAFGSHIHTAAAVHAEGYDAALATIPAQVPVYLTIDADGIDPTEMPGVMAPVPGGLHFGQVAPFLRTLAARHRIVGLDVVEIAPTFDVANGITCITAGRLIVNVLGASWAPAGAYGRAALLKVSNTENDVKSDVISTY